MLRVKPSFISNLVHDIVSIYGPQLSRGASSSNFGLRRAGEGRARGSRRNAFNHFDSFPWALALHPCTVRTEQPLCHISMTRMAWS